MVDSIYILLRSDTRLVWDTMAMLSPAAANQRPAFRSRDLTRPIRGQWPIRGLGWSVMRILTIIIIVRPSDRRHVRVWDILIKYNYLGSMSFFLSHIICFPLQYRRQEVHKVLNNKQTIEDKLIVCLSNIFLPSLIDMHLEQGKQEHSNIMWRSY